MMTLDMKHMLPNTFTTAHALRLGEVGGGEGGRGGGGAGGGGEGGEQG